MMRRLYLVLALLIIGGYGYADWRGFEPFVQTTRGNAQQSIRGAHGGGRTFWYSGYRGGK